jgi:DNA-binding transcriptional LysR family regulator
MIAHTLRLFLAVAQHASFAAAAREHELDPSAVSRAVAALEKELGIRLLQRSTRRVTLTEAGVAYLNRVEPVVQELEAAAEEASALSSAPRGVLRLTASVAFGNRCLVPLLPRLRSTFPELALELLLTDANLDLGAERIDLAVRLAPSVSADVIGVKLFDTRYRVCASPSWLRANASFRDPDQLWGSRAYCSAFRSSAPAGSSATDKVSSGRCPCAAISSQRACSHCANARCSGSARLSSPIGSSIRISPQAGSSTCFPGIA